MLEPGHSKRFLCGARVHAVCTQTKTLTRPFWSHWHRKKMNNNMEEIVAGGTKVVRNGLEYGIFPLLIAKMLVFWVAEVVMLLVSTPRVLAHPLRLKDGVALQIKGLGDINRKYERKARLLRARAEYIIDRYVFHAPVCVLGKMSTGPKPAYEFKNVALSKGQGFEFWAAQNLSLGPAGEKVGPKSYPFPGPAPQKLSHIPASPQVKCPARRSISNPVDLVLPKQSTRTVSTSLPVITLRITPRPTPFVRSIAPNDSHYLAQVIAEIRSIIPSPHYDDGSLAPIFLRLAWHCCATYDRFTNTGGSNGATMRFPPEATDEGNTGLHVTRAALEPVKAKFPRITYSDLWTLAGKVAIEAMGGPEIAWRCGRVDCKLAPPAYGQEAPLGAKVIPPNGRLPFGDKDANHIRKTFDRMGFDDSETVALLGAHGMGRCHPQYSGWEGTWTHNPTQFTNNFFTLLLSQQWHQDKVPSTGRCQYFNHDKTLMMLNTDMELARDPGLRRWAQAYTDDALFRRNFSGAFSKLLELGITRDEDGVPIWSA